MKSLLLLYQEHKVLPFLLSSPHYQNRPLELGEMGKGQTSKDRLWSQMQDSSPSQKSAVKNDKVNNNVDSAFIFLMNILISQKGQSGQVGENWHKDDWDMLPILFLQTGFVSAGHASYMRRPVVSL